MSQVASTGSCEKDNPVSIIAMEKEEQASLMHDLRLGKGERHAHKTSERLAQRVLPPLHMGRFSRLFSHRQVLFLWDHRPVRLCWLLGPSVQKRSFEKRETKEKRGVHVCEVLDPEPVWEQARRTFLTHAAGRQLCEGWRLVCPQISPSKLCYVFPIL